MKPWPIAGHRWAVQQLRRAIECDELPHALLLTGPESVGKRTLAELVVAALLCRADENKPCGVCLSCRKLRSGNHPDLILVTPEDRTAHLKIDQIREVERFLALTPIESAHKIALIGDFERATVGAANALLKTLEEPPSYAHLVLLALDADLLLPTIVSRAQHIPLRPLAVADVEDALVRVWNVDPERARLLARMSGGRIGWAVQAAASADVYERTRAIVDTLLAVLEQDLPSRFETAQVLAREGATLPEVLEYWLTFWRDVLLVQAGENDEVIHTDRHTLLDAIAAAIAVQDTVRVLDTLENAQEALLTNANTQLLVENVLLDLPTLRLPG